MQLWIQWWMVIKRFRPCFTRQQTFLWFAVCVMAFSIRTDLVGVSSFIRALGIEELYYDRLLDFFHSKAVRLGSITKTWIRLLLELGLAHKINGQLIIIADGVKAPKEGCKMPGVKCLHQDSESNSKSEFIMGHSFQALCLLMTAAGYFFATPIISQIHEGIIESNRDQRTLLDKMIIMLASLGISQPFYLVADAYYASGKIILPLLRNDQHLISRARSNAVAFEPAKPKKTGRGRPKLYGKKIKLKDIFSDKDLMTKTIGAIYIEVSFKQSLRTLGIYSYHFWMRTMTKIKKCSGDQYLHRKPVEYRNQVKRKMNAYHTHVQLGIIAQGIIQILAMTAHKLVWQHFGSWIRTIRPNILPSEAIVMNSLINTLPEFLKGSTTDLNIEKFILDKIDLSRAEGQRMIA